MTHTLGFVGSGRMATALGRGCVASGLVDGQQVLAVDPNETALQQFSEQVSGSQAVNDLAALIAKSDVVMLAVKPQVMPDVLKQIAPHANERHLFVSIAAGITSSTLAAGLPVGKIIRVMPNTPCLVGMGASCYSLARDANESDGQLVAQILGSVGSATEVEEPLLDAVTGLSGSGPAFVYAMIEALAHGGTQMGLPADLALQLATQTARGAAEMLQETGNSPEELRQQVTSPGGTTLAGLQRLDELDGAAAFRAAVEAATKRSIELGKL